MSVSRPNPKRPRTGTVEHNNPASNQPDASSVDKPTAPRTAATLKHLTGYADTARVGGLTFGDDHETVNNPTSVFAIDDAIEAVKAVKSCAVCEDPGCDAKATHGADHSKANPRRCRRHREKADVPVLCSRAGCTVKTPLVRSSSDPDGPAICLWHALTTPASYKFVRGVDKCTCGKHARFGIGKTRMACGPCASVVNRHLGTELTYNKAGNCARCGERQGHDTATRTKDDKTVRVCRPCYLEIEADGKDSGFKPGARCHACYKAGCRKSATLTKTVNGITTVSCPEHAKTKDTAYKHIIRPCRETNCRQRAYYAANFGDKPVACSDHKTEGIEFDVVHPRCRACLATQLNWYDATHVEKRGGLCRGCTQDGGGPVHRFYEKTIVSAITSKLRDDGIAFDAVLDMPINMHASSTAFRPDLVLRFDTKTVFVEVDERQHTSYDCERRREAAIFSSVADLEREKLMIRINPDAGGAAYAMFAKKPTVVELVDHGDAAFLTPRFDEKMTEVVDLCTRFVAGEVRPGYVHHINWTSDAPPRPIYL